MAISANTPTTPNTATPKHPLLDNAEPRTPASVANVIDRVTPTGQSLISTRRSSNITASLLRVYNWQKSYYSLYILSNINKLNEISNSLAEPEGFLRWREGRLHEAEGLPRTLHYGIGITGLLPLNEVAFDQTADYHVDASKGIEIYTWKEAVTQEEIAPILLGLMESDFFPRAGNYYGGLAQASFRSGIVVYVPPSVDENGVLNEEQLALDTMVPKGASSDVVIVIAKEGAKLALTTAMTGGDSKSVFSRTLVVLTGEGALVRVTQQETLAKGTMVLAMSRGVVAAHSSCAWSEVFSGEALLKSETDNLLIGESAHGVIMQGIVASGNTQYDIFAGVRHCASHTTSAIHAAGLSSDTSKVVYRGLIDMKEGVSRVRGTQEARFLVQSPKAKVDAIPSLDIASKDVECMHKLSISHIKEGDMFYPKLRGLSDAESRALFLSGHFSQVFAGEANKGIMDIIQNKLSGETEHRSDT